LDAETRWGDDTVSLGPGKAEGLLAEGIAAEEAPEAPKTSPPREDVAWGSETVVLDGPGAGRPGAFPRVGRRESPRRALLGAAIGVALLVLTLAVGSLIGNDGDRLPQPRASSVIRKAPHGHSSGTAIRIKEYQRRRLARKVRAVNAAKERRQRHRETAKDKAAAAVAEPSPSAAPETEAEYAPEYSPDPVPEAAPAPEAAPPFSGSPRRPAWSSGCRSRGLRLNP
jgi:hypothetical protein